MARALNTSVDLVLDRVRQSGGIAVTNDFTIKLLTYCQQIVNIALKRIIVSETFSTSAEQLIYPMSDLTTAVDIVSIDESNRSLFHIKNINDFSAYEKNWFRNITATRFEAWGQIGRDYFIIYPGKASASSVTIESVKETTIYTDYSTEGANNFELPDEDAEIAIKLCETILLVRSRKYDLVKSNVEALTATLGIKNVFN